MWKNGQNNLIRSLLISTTIAGAAGAVGAEAFTAQAVAAEAAPMVLEEIKVTSRKREESLQEIPESISVFTGLQLETADVETMRDFIDLTPNMIIRETFRSNESFLTMRGIASAQGALPPVAIVIDGVQVGANEFLNQDLLDIERVEVLRGPQGALYGQGAIAGAINIVTKDPTNELEAYINGSYGKADTYRVAGSVSGPIVEDKLFARVSGYYKHTDGLIKNIRGQDITFGKEYSVRGKLLFKGERLNAALRASYTDSDGSCCIQDKVPQDPDSGLLIGIDNISNPFTADSNIIGQEDTKFTDVSLKLDYDFDGVTVTSITGYAKAEQDIFADLDFSAVPNQIQDVAWDSEVVNQELRFSSNNESAFRWIFGGYYQDKKEVMDALVQSDPGGAPLFAFINDINSKLWALFGQVNVDLTENLELTGALRYDHDKQTFENRLSAGSYRDAKFDQLQPKIQLSYDWTENVMAYATWSKGFRTGGFDQVQKFDNEVATNYEFGVKATALDGLLVINTSIFHIDYANQQLSFVVLDPNDATNTLRGVLNIPATDIEGLELEVTARPMDGLDVNLGVGVTDTSIQKIDETSVFASPEAIGKTSPLAPPFTFNAGFTYTHPVAADMNLLLTSNYRRRGGYYFDLNNTIKTKTGDFIDAKIAIEGPNWSAGIYGRNLGNTRRATNMSITGSRLRVPNDPRSYGIEASYNF